MQEPSDIDAYRRAAFRGLIDLFQHPCIGMHAEYAAVQAQEGSLHDADGREVPSIFAIAEEIPIPEGHPDGGGNRAMRRAAKAKTRRQAL